MKAITRQLEHARATLTLAIEKQTAGQPDAAAALFHVCREHILRTERICDEISGEMKCWIDGVKP